MNFKINRKTRCTSRQLAEQLADRIRDGVFPPGSRLPSQVELSQETGLHRNTVKAAFRELRDQGLIKYLPTVGCVVRDDAPFRAALILPEDYGSVLEVWSGMNEALSDRGRTELFFYSNAKEFVARLKQIREERFSGAAIYLEHGAAEQIIRLRDSGFPLVQIDNFLKDSPQGWFVDSGLYDAGLLLTEHLLENRHMPVAIAAPDNPAGRKFVDGFREAHRKRREPAWSQHVKMLTPKYHAGLVTIDLLASPKQPGAIIYAQPTDALTGGEVLKHAGRNDIPIACFGSLPSMSLWSVPLVTANRNFRLVGIDAGKMLLELRQLSKPQRLVLRTIRHRPTLSG